MPCGTRLYAGFRGTVVRPTSPGSLGSAYGAHAFRLRNTRMQKDFVIGHVRTVYVQPGDQVARGTLIALASDAGAPDGCHLHFEVRPAAQGYDAAIAPQGLHPVALSGAALRRDGEAALGVSLKPQIRSALHSPSQDGATWLPPGQIARR
jgi:murein DD-endopeptidase MepM/ murein hydrolase activator NlpD